MKKRKEPNKIDIAVSIMLFIICLAVFFVIVEPLLIKPEDLTSLLKLAEENVNNLYWSVEKVPVVTYSNGTVEDVSWIILEQDQYNLSEDEEYGASEILKGISTKELAALDKMTYSQAKLQWNFPLKNDFYLLIEHENGALVLEKGHEFRNLQKTLTKEYITWLLFDDGKQDRIKITLRVG